MNNVVWYPGMKLEDVEKSVILLAFKYHQNNKMRTADSLGIAVRTLDAKLEKYGVKEKSGTETVQSERPPTGLEATRLQTETRKRMESINQFAPQQSVPVREPTQVQGLPPAEASGIRKPEGRASVPRGNETPKSKVSGEERK